MPDLNFRREALDAAQWRRGYPVDVVGVPGLVLSAFLVFVLIATGVFLGAMTYSRKETVPGFLAPPEGSARIVASRPGYVHASHVKDGDAVEADQILFTIISEQPTSDGGTVAARLNDANVTQLRAAEEALRLRQSAALNSQRDAIFRRDGLRAEISRLRSDLRLQQERVQLTAESEAAAAALNERGLMSAVAYRQRQEATLAARQTLSSIQQQIETTEVRLSQIAVEVEQARLGAAQAEADTAAERGRLLERTTAIDAERAGLIAATRAGRVVATQARLGDAVTAGQTLAVIVPRDSGLEVVLWAPSRAVGFIQPGAAVRLMYDAFPYQRFGAAGGRVISIDAYPSEPPASFGGAASPEPLYRIRVRPDAQSIQAYGRRWLIPAGGRVQADLVLEQRSLIGWLLEPITATAARR